VPFAGRWTNCSTLKLSRRAWEGPDPSWRASRTWSPPHTISQLIHSVELSHILTRLWYISRNSWGRIIGCLQVSVSLPMWLCFLCPILWTSLVDPTP
jgi:hypothetical protein